jgi:hypothetical protein
VGGPAGVLMVGAGTSMISQQMTNGSVSAKQMAFDTATAIVPFGRVFSAGGKFIPQAVGALKGVATSAASAARTAVTQAAAKTTGAIRSAGGWIGKRVPGKNAPDGSAAAKALLEEGKVDIGNDKLGGDLPARVYRSGSSTPRNLTPAEKDQTGLSTFDHLENFKPGSKVQVIDTSLLRTLLAVPDESPPGHVSIRPPDLSDMSDWIASRETETVHPYTQEVLNAIVDEIRIPKQ